VPVYGDGRQVRDWLFVTDHCEAIDVILHEGKIGETYCIGGRSERENIWIVKKLIEIMGVDESMIEFVSDRPGHDRRYAIDFSKIHDELGWQPEVTIEEGLAKTVEWFRENETWWKRTDRGH
jgi:dTDP-glucose 4,6-dehydratase